MVTLPGDMDLDGDIDVVMLDGGGMRYVQNELVLGAAPSYGIFTDGSSSITLAVAGVTDGVLADFDLDGDLELAVVTAPFGGGRLWVMTNDVDPATGTPFSLTDSAASGWVATTPGVFTSIVAADFDGDGDPDLLLGGPGGLTLLDNGPGALGARVFTDVSAATVGAFVGSVADLAATDADGDGDFDFVIAGGAFGAPIRTVAVNAGPGLPFAFAVVPGAPAVSGFPTSVQAADLDEDGDDDLIFGLPAVALIATPGAWFDGQLEIYENDGMAAFAFLQIAGTLQSYTGVVVGDVDEDGLADIIASGRRESAVGNPVLPARTLMFSRPAAGAAFVDITDAGPALIRIDDDSVFDGDSIALADMDLDLDLDIVAGHRFASTPGIFTNMLWQLEARRDVALSQLMPPTQDAANVFYWDISYDLYSELGVPNFGGGTNIGIVAASLGAPVHQFPATLSGYATAAPWVSGPVVTAIGPSSFTMRLGLFDAATAASFVGTSVYGQAGTLALMRGVTRFSNVVQTTLQ